MPINEALLRENTSLDGSTYPRWKMLSFGTCSAISPDGASLGPFTAASQWKKTIFVSSNPSWDDQVVSFANLSKMMIMEKKIARQVRKKLDVKKTNATFISVHHKNIVRDRLHWNSHWLNWMKLLTETFWPIFFWWIWFSQEAWLGLVRWNSYNSSPLSY